MALVQLEDESGNKRSFGFTHAQAILDLNRANRTTTWSLDDPKYVIDENGIIISNPDPGASQES